MSTYNLIEERLERLSERQQRLARMLLRTLRPGERERVLTEKSLVDSEINRAHQQLSYAQRVYTPTLKVPGQEQISLRALDSARR